jgi:LPS-assembly protein
MSNYKSSDGLIIKSLDMNDVDYINTKYDNDTNNYTNRFLESKIKYFYNTNNYYGDIDVRLYNDISKQNNNDVMQNIPTINIHHYSSDLFIDKLSSSIDIMSTRKIRDIGLSGNKTDIYIPLNYHQYFFNNYLNLLLSEQINFINIDYTNNDNNYKDVNYGTNNHIISLYTDLVKPYKSHIHSLNFNITYTKPESFKKIGDIYKITNNDTNLSIFPITQTNQSISLGLNQSVYNKNSLKQIVNHKMNQLYVFQKDKNIYEKNGLENDITYFYDYGSLSNRLIYNYNIKKITSSSFTFKFKKNNSFLNLYYSYKKDKTTLMIQKDINYDLGINLYKYYTASYKEEYDISSKYSKKREYILNINKKCWAVNFKFIDSVIATNTTNNNTLRQNILYMEFNLKQLFKLNQKYKFKEKVE